MKKFSIILTLAALCACLSSCAKENKAESGNALIGTWELETVVIECLKDFSRRDYDDDEITWTDIEYKKGDIATLSARQYGGRTLTFRNDGLFTIVYTYYKKNGTIKGKSGYVMPYLYDESTQTLETNTVLGDKIKKLTESEFHVTEETEYYIETQQFKRVR